MYIYIYIYVYIRLRHTAPPMRSPLASTQLAPSAAGMRVSRAWGVVGGPWTTGVGLLVGVILPPGYLWSADLSSFPLARAQLAPSAAGMRVSRAWRCAGSARPADYG